MKVIWGEITPMALQNAGDISAANIKASYISPYREHILGAFIKAETALVKGAGAAAEVFALNGVTVATHLFADTNIGSWIYIPFAQSEVSNTTDTWTSTTTVAATSGTIHCFLVAAVDLADNTVTVPTGRFGH